MMLQKITFNELKENVALVDKKDIRTRAHKGMSRCLKPSCLKNQTVITNL